MGKAFATMKKIARSRTLWAYVIGIAALVIAYWITSAGDRKSEMGYGILAALLFFAVLGLLALAIIFGFLKKTRDKVKYIVLFGILAVGIAIGELLSISPRYSPGFGWWNWQGLSAWVVLVVGAAIAIYIE